MATVPMEKSGEVSAAYATDPSVRPVWTMIRQISLVYGVEVLPPANVSNLVNLNF